MTIARSGYADGDPDLAQAIWAADENMEARRSTRRRAAFGAVFIVMWLAFLFWTWPAEANEPFWLGPNTCTTTNKALATAERFGLELMHWETVSSEPDGLLAFWGAPSLAHEEIDKPWFLTMHLSNGMVCTVLSGRTSVVPDWFKAHLGDPA